MKIWREFNSSHSSNITIIGEFSEPKNLEKHYEMIQDFILGAWEERHASIEDFNDHWAKEFDPNVRYIGITNDEYFIGIDNDPDIKIEDGNLKISKLRMDNLGGIIKLLRFAGKCRITII
ncbi:hypothetical protein [Chitinophaga cymbidii]|uniref:Uncharacterized protein n=1 Tax=Chitinophaga cymbidii TaxID=1096750 RepID=A0A512RR03_9BACT|nr:hypothetical protein [Chitinophaga cymbidii]GEP98118.1 hypothetical protein CCY01nite_43780 [Chitinophaga cymbidii]